MILNETGETRVRGYLYVLDRSLRTFLPREIVDDAVREVESHIRERVAQVEPAPDPRAALERVLGELGPPLRVAQAYSAELTIDEAVTTGRTVAVARALWHFATTTTAGFFGTLGLFVGYAVGVAFLAIAALKPIFPNNVGLLVSHGWLVGFGAQFDLPPDVRVLGGYWIIPLSLAIGLGILIATHRGARAFVAWMGRRRETWRRRAGGGQL